MSSVGAPLRIAAAARRLVDLALPHRCAVCGTVLGSERGLCAACWTQLHFIAPPVCPSCGRPQAEDGADLDPCAICRSNPPRLRRQRAALAYDDAGRRLVIAFKHHGRLSLRPLLIRWLQRTADELLTDVDLVAPVPLHRGRLLRRGFNQSALLAAGLAEAGTVAHVPDLLWRVRATRSQQGLNARARAANVTAAAFAVRPRWRARVAGSRVLLVDDVLTTGATLEACARVLQAAGATAVDAVCLARVTRPTPAPIS